MADPASMTALGTAFFGAVSEVSQLVPKFDEKRKKEIDELYADIVRREKVLHDYAVSFGPDSFMHVLLGLAKEVETAKQVYQEKYIIFAKEIKG